MGNINRRHQLSKSRHLKKKKKNIYIYIYIYDLHDHRKRDNTSDLFKIKARVPDSLLLIDFEDNLLFIYTSLLNAYNGYHLTEKLFLIVLDW